MYEDFANVYDFLTNDIDYKERCKYLLSLFGKFDRKPTLLLDLACGTGNFTVEFAKQGISAIGVDISEEMLSKATQKSTGLDILYLCQDAAELDLYGTVDGAVCCLDSLNHIADYEKLAAAIKRVSLFLEKDRLFIFDLNTEYKHREVLGNNTFVSEDENVYCVWQNEYTEEDKTVNMALDFFVLGENGLYERFCDDVCERAYTKKEIEDILKSAGLKVEAVYGDMTETKPDEKCERVIYITRKAE